MLRQLLLSPHLSSHYLADKVTLTISNRYSSQAAFFLPLSSALCSLKPPPFQHSNRCALTKGHAHFGIFTIFSQSGVTGLMSSPHPNTHARTFAWNSKKGENNQVFFLLLERVIFFKEHTFSHFVYFFPQLLITITTAPLFLKVQNTRVWVTYPDEVGWWGQARVLQLTLKYWPTTIKPKSQENHGVVTTKSQMTLWKQQIMHRNQCCSISSISLYTAVPFHGSLQNRTSHNCKAEELTDYTAIETFISVPLEINCSSRAKTQKRDLVTYTTVWWTHDSFTIPHSYTNFHQPNMKSRNRKILDLRTSGRVGDVLIQMTLMQ